MTQIFLPDGNVQAITVVEAGPCVVLQRKTVERDGYSAIQLGFADKKEKNTTKPEAGHVKKSGLKVAKRHIKEMRVPAELQVNEGSLITTDVFAVNEVVKVTGKTMGRGFQGAIKRHGFASGPSSHGSKTHRYPGTLGAGTGKSNVLKGKKQPGHYGNETVTIANLKIVDILPEKNVILISGAIPGPKNSLVLIKNNSEYDAAKIKQPQAQATPAQA